jgi:hypothetical protein
LGRRRFAAKPKDYGYWISLDFLGFSRANRDFSMGYTDKTEKSFSSRFCRRERAVETVKPTIWHGEGTDCSWGKLNSISNFPQDIATRFRLAVSIQKQLA